MSNLPTLYVPPGLPVHVPDEVWYRYEDVQYAAPLDEWENPVGPGRVAVELRTYRVARHTPKGAWLYHHFYFGSSPAEFNRRDCRFVRITDGKMFAHPTREGALASFIARKTRQMKILSAQLRRAALALELASGL